MTTSEALIFLYGADMHPVEVRSTYPEAQFVARARVVAGGLPAPRAAESQRDIWGILVRVPAAVVATEGVTPVTATTDEGIDTTATPATTAQALASPADVLAAARYWELPPSYVAALAAAAG